MFEVSEAKTKVGKKKSVRMKVENRILKNMWETEDPETEAAVLKLIEDDYSEKIAEWDKVAEPPQTAEDGDRYVKATFQFRR